MTLSPMTKFSAALAYLKSHSLFANNDLVYSATLPDSHTPYQPIRSLESVPRWEMVTGHRRNGECLQWSATHHLDSPDLPWHTRVSQRLRPCSWRRIDRSGGRSQRQEASA